jgi:hypothetical protein
MTANVPTFQLMFKGAVIPPSFLEAVQADIYLEKNPLARL